MDAIWKCFPESRERRIRAVIPKAIRLSFLLMACYSGALHSFAEELLWNVPQCDYRDRASVTVYFILKSYQYIYAHNTYSNTEKPAYEALLNNVSGISGEILYDANIFSSPRIQPGERATNVMATGFVVEPGVFRFTIYTSPVGRVPRGLSTEEAAAQFQFHHAPNVAFDGEFTWRNCKAAKYKDETTGLRCREKFEAMELAPVYVHNSVEDWCVYE